MSQEYVVERNTVLNARQSAENEDNNWNWHIKETAEETAKRFEIAKTRLIKVIK
jgi:hypothetical protein